MSTLLLDKNLYGPSEMHDMYWRGPDIMLLNYDELEIMFLSLVLSILVLGHRMSANADTMNNAFLL